jgi:hypothetical protein
VVPRAPGYQACLPGYQSGLSDYQSCLSDIKKLGFFFLCLDFLGANEIEHSRFWHLLRGKKKFGNSPKLFLRFSGKHLCPVTAALPTGGKAIRLAPH